MQVFDVTPLEVAKKIPGKRKYLGVGMMEVRCKINLFYVSKA